jgi:NADPH:quinone reductase-like Zn-dependent oxidoreductase
MKTPHSVILPAYNRNIIRAIISLKFGERELPDLKPNEVLIKMEAAPVNPSDIAFIRGEYNVDKPMPSVPGFEGAGIVVETGVDAVHFMGKRVSSFVQGDKDGTWAEYFTANSNSCIIIKDELPVEQAACLSINPFTAYALMEIAKEKNSKAIVQNAAGGQVAGFVRVFAQKAGISVINIVRKPEQVEILKSEGEQFVLNSTDNDFEEQFGQLANDLSAGIAFDAVGGEITGKLINNMPAGSDVVLYGGLSGSDIQGINSLEVIFGNKKLTGFDLNKWIAEKNRKEFQTVADEIQDLIIAGELKTEVQAEFPVADIVSAIRAYIKSMSAGKVLLRGQ